MSWLFGKPRKEADTHSNGSGNAAAEPPKGRSAALHEFTHSVPSVQLAIEDRGAGVLVYRLPIQTVYGRLSIHVIIGPTFPDKPPVLVMSTKCVHRFIDPSPSTLGAMLQTCVPTVTKLKQLGLDQKTDGGVVLTPRIRNWLPSSSLTQTVLEIKQEFELHAPTPAILMNGNNSGSNSSASNSLNSSAHSSVANTPLTSPHHRLSNGGSSQTVPPPVTNYRPPNANFVPPLGAANYQQGLSVNQNGANGVTRSSSFPTALSDSAANSSSTVSDSAAAASSAQPTSTSSTAESSISTFTPIKQTEIPTSYPILDTMRIVELEDMAYDEDTFVAFAEQLDGVQQVEQMKTGLYKSLEELATKNIDRRKELNIESMEASLESRRLELQTILAELQALQQQQHSIHQKYDVVELQSELNEAIDEADIYSDQLRDSFEPSSGGQTANAVSPSSADNDITKFVNAYLKSRMVFHERNAKRESLQESYGNT